MYCVLALEKTKYIGARYSTITYENFEFNNLMYIHLKVLYILLRYYDLYIRSKTLIDLIFFIFILVSQIIIKIQL